MSWGAARDSPESSDGGTAEGEPGSDASEADRAARRLIASAEMLKMIVDAGRIERGLAGALHLAIEYDPAVALALGDSGRKGDVRRVVIPLDGAWSGSAEATIFLLRAEQDRWIAMRISPEEESFRQLRSLGRDACSR